MNRLPVSIVLLLFIAGIASAQPLPQPRLQRDPRIRPVGGFQVEVLRALDDHILGGPEGSIGPIYVGEPFNLDLRITAPGAESVKVDLDREAYAPYDVLRIDLVRRNRAQQPTIRGFAVDAEGKALVDVGAKITDLTMVSGSIPLYLVVTERSGSVEKTRRVNAGTLPIIGFKAFRLRGTHAIATRLKFNFYVTPTGPTAWVCEGVSTGPTGRFTVGKVKAGEDMAFKIRSGPLGGNCMWESFEKIKIDHPWKIVAMNFATTATSQCHASGDDDDLRRDPPSAGTLRHDQIFIGKFPRIVLKDLNQPADRFPIMHVSLQCGKTASNDHSIEMRMTEIELLGPENETLEQAFNGFLFR